MKQISKLLLVAVGVAFLVGCGGGSGGGSSLSKAEKTYNKGNVAYEAGKYSKAMRLYKEAIKQGSSNGEPESQRAILGFYTIEDKACRET